MRSTRPAAVAGMFYPANPDELQSLVDALLAAVPEATGKVPKVLVAPHAGYVYSGSTAAAAYALLRPLRQQIRRVVLLGPTHRVAVDGLAVPESTAFATPLGDIPLDLPGIARLRQLPFVVASDRVHAQEHSLEVHLPFLQTLLDDFTLLPLAVGEATPEQVAEVLGECWGGAETLIVISSDLSHFLQYHQARQVDRDTCRQILALQAQISPQQACGAYPLNGLLLTAQQRYLQPSLIQLCNSGDTAGDKQRVVGYASFAFHEPEENHA